MSYNDLNNSISPFRINVQSNGHKTSEVQSSLKPPVIQEQSANSVRNFPPKNTTILQTPPSNQSQMLNHNSISTSNLQHQPQANYINVNRFNAQPNDLPLDMIWNRLKEKEITLNSKGKTNVNCGISKISSETLGNLYKTNTEFVVGKVAIHTNVASSAFLNSRNNVNNVSSVNNNIVLQNIVITNPNPSRSVHYNGNNIAVPPTNIMNISNNSIANHPNSRLCNIQSQINNNNKNIFKIDSNSLLIVKSSSRKENKA